MTRPPPEMNDDLDPLRDSYRRSITEDPQVLERRAVQPRQGQDVGEGCLLARVDVDAVELPAVLRAHVVVLDGRYLHVANSGLVIELGEHLIDLVIGVDLANPSETRTGHEHQKAAGSRECSLLFHWFSFSFHSVK